MVGAKQTAVRPKTAGALLMAAPALWVVVELAEGSARAVAAWQWLLATVATMALLGGAPGVLRGGRQAQWLVTLGLGAIGGALAPVASSAPQTALAVVIWVYGMGLLVWRLPTARFRGHQEVAYELALSSNAAGIALWLAVMALPDASTVGRAGALAGVLVVFVVNVWNAQVAQRAAALVVLVAVLTAVLGLGFWLRAPSGLDPAGAVLMPLGGLALLRRPLEMGEPWWLRSLAHPARLLAATFFVLCVLGTLLLMVPKVSDPSRGIPLLDAAFTAVSAVCVTGLAVLDTGRDFTPLGQGVLLLLIQVGGLGIMTFSTLALQLLGARMSLQYEGVVAGLLGTQDRREIARLARRVVATTFAFELVGAAALTLVFCAEGLPVPRALWKGCFTAVSAFCNAGFALDADSLVAYQHSPWVLHLVGALIVAGGVSPAVIHGVLQRPRMRALNLQARLVLTTTALLLVAGWVSFLALEWDHSLAPLSLLDRVHNAWFQSVTTRTAGFNSVDLNAVSSPTITLMLLLMFVGGAPGGTAGGVKVTTAAVLFLAVRAALRGEEDVRVFGWKLDHRLVYRAAAIVTSGALTGMAAFLALQLTQSLPAEMALFETISAVGTVGLTLGATAALDGVGKIVIIMCMFMGRIGPLTLFLLLSNRVAPVQWDRPVGELDVG